MVLEVKNPRHQESDANGWVALTADAPWPVGERIFHIRDMALSAAAAEAETAEISLPTKSIPVHLRFGMEEANGTVTDGVMRYHETWEGAAHGTGDTEPTPANGDTNGSEAVPRTTADANQWGEVFYPAHKFKVRGTSLAGTKTTIEFRAVVRLQEPYTPE